MKNKKSLITALLVIVPFQFSNAQSGDGYVVPTTEWGQPDLQGVWNFNSETPMQRPEEFGDREFLTAEEVQQARVTEGKVAQRPTRKKPSLTLILKPHRLLKARVATTASGSKRQQ